MIKIDVLKNIDEAVKLLNELDDYQDSLSDELSKQDLSLSDLYHFIEFNKMDSKACYRMVKELKRVLSKRRKIKNDMALLRTFESQKDRLQKKSNRDFLISNIHKQDKSLKQYSYNIYTEEELKEILVK